MVKMIFEIPRHIDVEEFVELTMDVIKGRFGKDSYYSGVKPYATWIIRPEEISLAFAKGYSGKNGVRYYEIDAEELDPVIIATMEEVGKMFGMKYDFVDEKKFLPVDWWKPYKADKDFHKKPYSEEIETARNDYENLLMLLNGTAYYTEYKLYKMA